MYNIIREIRYLMLVPEERNGEYPKCKREIRNFHNNKRIISFFEKYKCPGIAFFLQSSRYISNEQWCLETTGLHDDLLLLSSLFHFFYFIFSVPISFSLCFPISPSLLFFMFFKPLSSVVEKFLYTYIYK